MIKFFNNSTIFFAILLFSCSAIILSIGSVPLGLMIIRAPSFSNFFIRNLISSFNLKGLLIGIVLLLMCQDVLNFDLVWKLLLPAILVAIGISIIFKDVIGGKVNKEIKKLDEKRNDENQYCATFSEQNVNFNGEVFKGAELTAVFGGVNCDLRNAIIESDVVINASSIFGGIDIYVPSNVKVKVKSNAIFGGVSNKAYNKPEENSKTIYINGKALFGGVEIKWNLFKK